MTGLETFLFVATVLAYAGALVFVWLSIRSSSWLASHL